MVPALVTTLASEKTTDYMREVRAAVCVCVCVFWPVVNVSLWLCRVCGLCYCLCKSVLNSPSSTQSAALALSVASTDPAIQNLLRSSVLLFSSVFAAALEQDNFRLRALIVDLMANCAKNGKCSVCVCVHRSLCVPQTTCGGC